VVELPVARAEDDVVLEDEGRDPDVVRRNRRSLVAELAEGRGVVVRVRVDREPRFQSASSILP